jgi:hypothetical protein
MSCNSPTVDGLGIDKDLVLEFFCTFSRFEYALKRAEFVDNPRGFVVADWKCFETKLQTLGTDKCASVLKVCEYLLRHPPKKQVLREKRLAWTDEEDTSTPDIKQVLRYVQSVRNNLFHGGKFSDGSIEEVARNKQLIQDSLAVLKAILGLPGVEEVARHFSP